jgi:signal transduction histidine kinase
VPFESVLSLSEDSERGLWVVSHDGRLAYGLDDVWDVVSAGTNWPGGRADCVAADSKGGVWVGTRDRGLKHLRDGVWHEWLPRNGLAAGGVRSLLVGSNGDVWVASLSGNRLQRLRNGVVQTVTNTTRLGPIRALAEGADGTIWIGTSEGEIQKVCDMKLMAEPAIKEAVPLSVRALLATPDGSLWIGYAGDGLGHLKDGRYQRLTSEAGLPDDFITQLLDDGGVNLWIAGNRGLSRVSFAELYAVIAGKSQRMSARRYGSADGLPGLQPSRDFWPSAWGGGDGRLWFAMRNGVLLVQPDKISENRLPPMVQLERVLVDDQLVALYNAGSPLQTMAGSNVTNLRHAGAKLHLAPGHRKLEIDFAALSFTSPENVQFRYQLSGFDSSWVEAGSRHNATYPRLPAGSYQFHVLACNNAGVWHQQGAVLAFTVAPFFWDTWWFKLGGGIGTALLAGGCAFAISRTRYRRRIRRLENRRALEQERVRIARDIHDDLGASLTRISLLSQPSGNDSEDKDTAAASLARIHQTARDLTHAMGEVVWAVNPEHDSFDSLANYISNYAQNFLRAARIRCRLEMPVQLPQLALSSGIRHNLLLAFKEALSNVAKHAQASEVRISLAANDYGIELLVADNGKGFPQSGAPGKDAPPEVSRPAPGNGLANMRNRLREIGGDCDIQSVPGTGTKITFRVMISKDHGRR